VTESVSPKKKTNERTNKQQYKLKALYQQRRKRPGYKHNCYVPLYNRLEAVVLPLLKGDLLLLLFVARVMGKVSSMCCNVKSLLPDVSNIFDAVCIEKASVGLPKLDIDRT
jgi:hypothetical protein